MITEMITITGLIATTPRYLTTADGLRILSFRLASSQRRYDGKAGKWIDGDTNWYTITSFHDRATNGSESLSKGDRILVHGRIRVRDWDNGDRAGTSIEIEAKAIGHDLSWGTSVFTRNVLVTEPDDNF